MKRVISAFGKLPKKKKIQAVTAFALSAVCAAVLPVLAWFSYTRKTANMVKINAPTILNIGAGNQEDIAMIDLSKIDVEERIDGVPVLEGDYVFCVKGKYLSTYDLQIARTTNIPFDYQLYRVSVIEGDESSPAKGWGFDGDSLSGSTDAEKLTNLKNKYSEYRFAPYYSQIEKEYFYYPYQIGDTLVNGSYINQKNDSGETIALQKVDENNIHSKSYKYKDRDTTYDNVDKYAEPLYWQAKGINVQNAGRLENGEFVDYYVLKIKWNVTFRNTKETDMIYISARRGS